MRLGKTNLKVNKNGFGALPIQRRNEEDSIEILKTAYDNEIDFYDSTLTVKENSEKHLKMFVKTFTLQQKPEWKQLKNFGMI